MTCLFWKVWHRDGEFGALEKSQIEHTGPCDYCPVTERHETYNMSPMGIKCPVVNCISVTRVR